MPVRAAFWIAAMVARSKVADSRRPLAAGDSARLWSSMVMLVSFLHRCLMVGHCLVRRGSGGRAGGVGAASAR
ncbi:hypothetical protein GCM10027079_18000 [Sediminivirga luteola]|uniref:Uncharacterized protein n=1 Tax=Sediminivirga luteola TaxID=1774748 RepID=A0A8J2TVT8_9MICO|nr:hypothetical protein GCM10011333_05470 [Sediminivirga luteola]